MHKLIHFDIIDRLSNWISHSNPLHCNNLIHNVQNDWELQTLINKFCQKEILISKVNQTSAFFQASEILLSIFTFSFTYIDTYVYLFFEPLFTRYKIPADKAKERPLIMLFTQSLIFNMIYKSDQFSLACFRFKRKKVRVKKKLWRIRIK